MFGKNNNSNRQQQPKDVGDEISQAVNPSPAASEPAAEEQAANPAEELQKIETESPAEVQPAGAVNPAAAIPPAPARDEFEWRTKSRVRFGGKLIEPGQAIDISDEQAAKMPWAVEKVKKA